MPKVNIYGAGLAGLVSAITLVRQGFEVTIYDFSRKIGGYSRWHPSIQTTVLNPQKTWNYIGIDLSVCFEPVDEITLYRYSNKKLFSLDNLYVCERGPRKGSLDSMLFNIARKEGVAFRFNEAFNFNQVDLDVSTILATGLNFDVYEQIGLPYIPIYGYKAILKKNTGNKLIAYMHKCTNYDFAYLASKNSLQFILLFSRGKINEKNLVEFKDLLRTTESIQPSVWQSSMGALPKDINLFYKSMILSGTLSGMIDPFVLHGVSGGLTSGKIAAMAVLNRTKAQAEFDWLTKNFTIKKSIKKISTVLPFKSFSVPMMMWIEAQLRGVGFVE